MKKVTLFLAACIIVVAATSCSTNKGHIGCPGAITKAKIHSTSARS